MSTTSAISDDFEGTGGAPVITMNSNIDPLARTTMVTATMPKIVTIRDETESTTREWRGKQIGLELLPAKRSLVTCVVVHYLHDVHWITSRLGGSKCLKSWTGSTGRR